MSNRLVIDAKAVDGPLLAQQRLALLMVQDKLSGSELESGFDGVVAELLLGLINFLDDIADQLHDKYGVQCLIGENTSVRSAPDGEEEEEENADRIEGGTQCK